LAPRPPASAASAYRLTLHARHTLVL
jgi:hypothetical protein